MYFNQVRASPGMVWKKKKTRCFRLTTTATGGVIFFCSARGSGIVHVARSKGDGTFTAVYVSNAGMDGVRFDFSPGWGNVLPFDYNGDGKKRSAYLQHQAK